MTPNLEEIDNEVFKFCVKNGIACKLGIDKKANAFWCTVFVSDNMTEDDFIFQIGHMTTESQFKALVRHFRDGLDPFEIGNIEGENFWFASNEDNIGKFIEKHGKVFEE